MGPVALGVLLSMLVGGCGGAASGGAGAGSSTPAAPSTTAAGAPTSAGSAPATAAAAPGTTPPLVVITDDGVNGTFTAGPGGVPTGTVPASAEARGVEPVPVLRAIRVARQDRFDRVELEFDGPVPGYRAEYVPQVVQDATGDPVPLAGTAFLQLAVQTATADDGSSRRYAGPTRLTPGYRQLRELRLVGDFEGVLGVGFGLAARRGFRVTALPDPSRIVVDLATG